jgi:hypothetical protein
MRRRTVAPADWLARVEALDCASSPDEALGIRSRGSHIATYASLTV